MGKALKASRILGVIAIAIFTIYTLDLHSHFVKPYKHGIGPTSAYNIIRIIFPIPLAMFAFWVSYSKVFELFLATTENKEHTHSTLGKILDIKYSNTRIGNKPLFKVTVEYDEFKKEFDYINENIQHHFKIGDPILVRYSSIDRSDASIDINGTLKESNNTLSGYNAKFKLIEINPTTKASNYELVGELIMPDSTQKKASLNHKIDDHNLTKFVPGMIIPCKIDGSGDDLSITMSIS